MLKTVLLVVLLLLSTLVVCWAFYNSKEFVRVTATGKAQVKPDQAQVDIGLRLTDITEAQLNLARQQSAATLQKIIDDVKQRVPKAKLETQGFTVSENYKPIATANDASANQPTTFTISNRFSVTIKDSSEIELLSSVIDSAIANGANDVGNVSYSLTDNATEKTLQQAQAMSMKNAYEKAKNLAESGGKKLGSIQTIEENGQPEVMPFFSRAAMSVSDSATATPILAPETVPVLSTVTVQYSLQ